MPRVWGSQVAASDGAKFRLGMDYSVSGTKITVSGYIAEFQGYFINDSSTRLTRTGKLSGSVTFPFRLSGNGTVSIPGSGGSFTGTRGSSYTFGGKMDQLPFAGLSASVSATVSIPTGLPTAPGRPSATNITTVGVRIGWTSPTNNGGSSVTSYQLQRYRGASTSGTLESTTSHTVAVNVTGLTPGTQYTFRVRARNANGYGPWSTTRTIRTKNAVWVRVSGVWKQAVPYVKHNGTWKEATAMVRHNGSWRSTG